MPPNTVWCVLKVILSPSTSAERRLCLLVTPTLPHLPLLSGAVRGRPPTIGPVQRERTLTNNQLHIGFLVARTVVTRTKKRILIVENKNEGANYQSSKG